MNATLRNCDNVAAYIQGGPKSKLFLVAIIYLLPTNCCNFGMSSCTHIHDRKFATTKIGKIYTNTKVKDRLFDTTYK